MKDLKQWLDCYRQILRETPGTLEPRDLWYLKIDSSTWLSIIKCLHTKSESFWTNLDPELKIKRINFELKYIKLEALSNHEFLHRGLGWQGLSETQCSMESLAWLVSSSNLLTAVCRISPDRVSLSVMQVLEESTDSKSIHFQRASYSE